MPTTENSPSLKKLLMFLQRFYRAVRKKLRPVKQIVKMVLGIDNTPFKCVLKKHFRTNLDDNEARKFFKTSVKMLEIEVFSFCNRKCWFCSNAHIDRHSQNIRMLESLYSKIISNLKEISYSNCISYSRYNEPLADRIILDRIYEARTTLPDATLHLNTNGDYLNQKYLEELHKVGLRSLNIQVYLPNNVEYSDQIASQYADTIMQRNDLPFHLVFEKTNEWLEYASKFKDMSIRLYARNFKLNGTDRGSIVTPLKKGTFIRHSPCLIPFHDMYIDYNGKVVPCCNLRSDWSEHAKYVLGDLNEDEETLFSIFSSPSIVAWRKSLISYGKKKPPCSSCIFEAIPGTIVNKYKSKQKSKYIP